MPMKPRPDAASEPQGPFAQAWQGPKHSPSSRASGAALSTFDTADTPLERALLALSLGHTPKNESLRPRSRRVNLCRPVRFRPLDGQASVVGAIQNLSVGGALVRAPWKTRPGELVALGFFLRHRGHRSQLCTMGKVVWASPKRGAFGLAFVTPPQDVVRIIQDVVADHPKRIRSHGRKPLRYK